MCQCFSLPRKQLQISKVRAFKTQGTSRVDHIGGDDGINHDCKQVVVGGNVWVSGMLELCEIRLLSGRGRFAGEHRSKTLSVFYLEYS